MVAIAYGQRIRVEATRGFPGDAVVFGDSLGEPDPIVKFGAAAAEVISGGWPVNSVFDVPEALVGTTFNLLVGARPAAGDDVYATAIEIVSAPAPDEGPRLPFYFDSLDSPETTAMPFYYEVA